MTTLLTYAPALQHTKPNHPENRRRLIAILPALEKAGLMDHLIHVAPVPATPEQVLRVHAPELVNRVRGVSMRGGGLLDQGDTYATAETFDSALLAAGATCALVDQIMTGKVDNGFALIRPPGHHAEVSRAGGFCVFNNIAIAARQAQVQYGLQRVAIVDFDVHHGNGTQGIFYDDPSVHFTSAHLFTQYFYPGTGAWDETGTGPGKGYTLNVPMPPNVGDNGYQRAFQDLIVPALERFQPEIILVSIGFDAHWLDPLAMASLSLAGYASLTQMLIDAADRLCGGRIGFVLEGGYHLDVLTNGILNVFYTVLGESVVLDPYGPSPEPEQSIMPLIDRLVQLHLPN